MYQVNRAAWDRGLVSKAAMGDNLSKALGKLETITGNTLFHVLHSLS